MISYNYDTVDWYGADEYINFIQSPDEVIDIINNINHDEYKLKAEEFKSFMAQQNVEFYQKLNSLIK